MAAKICQRPSKLRLKDHHQGDGKKHRQAAQDPANDRQVKQLGKKREGQEDQRQPDEDTGSVRTAQVDVDIVEDGGEDADLHGDPPILRDKLSNSLKHGKVIGRGEMESWRESANRRLLQCRELPIASWRKRATSWKRI